MFIKLQRKMMFYILVTAFIFTTTMGVISFFFVSQSLYQNFQYSANENINQSIKNSLFSIDAAKSSTIQISQNANIIGAISSTEYNPSINPILNTLKNTSYGILGVTLYTTNDQVYTTSSISSYPTFNDFANNEQITQFMNSNDTIFLSIRTTAISQIYNHVRYDPQYGMISYVVKLYDDNLMVRGYLFVDIDPNYIYNNFFDYENYVNFKNVQTYIFSQNNDYLKSAKNSESNNKYLTQVLDNQSKISSDKKYFIISKSFNSDTKIITLVPMNSLYMNLLEIGSIILITMIILLLIAYVISKKFTKHIISSLTDLHKKMTETDLENDNLIGAEKNVR